MAQQTAIIEVNEESHLADRVAIQTLSFPNNFTTTQKGIDGNAMTKLIVETDPKKITRTDRYNTKRFLQSNAPWHNQSFEHDACRGVFKTFYKNTAAFFEKKGDGYYFSINPVIYYNQTFEFGDTTNTFLNTRGFEFKGNLKDKIYFYTNLYENQERMPQFGDQFLDKMNQVPGATDWKGFGKNNSATDYSIAQAYISAPIVKKHINITGGHGRHFIGDGYRSIFLSDFGGIYFYGKMNTQFWKFKFQNLITELNPTFPTLSTQLREKKYMAMHHLTFQASPRLEIGAFESIIFRRKNQFEFQYLNPIIFYRTIESHLGSPDNALLGLNFKAIPAKNTLLYGQALLDEFVFDKLIAREGWYNNKYAFQLGGKYINAFQLDNLDLQLEYNHIRPFMYSYADSIRDYSHHKQALAHPNGANLKEVIGIIKFQPQEKLRLSLEIIKRWQGIDSSVAQSSGGDIFKSNLIPLAVGIINGYNTGGGIPLHTFYANLNSSYELGPNLFIEGGIIFRTANSGLTGRDNATMANIGLRLNTARRRYNF
jgi:hypothetical protein